MDNAEKVPDLRDCIDEQFCETSIGSMWWGEVLYGFMVLGLGIFVAATGTSNVCSCIPPALYTCGYFDTRAGIPLSVVTVLQRYFFLRQQQNVSRPAAAFSRYDVDALMPRRSMHGVSGQLAAYSFSSAGLRLPLICTALA